MQDNLYRPAGASNNGPFDVLVTPENVGWVYSSLRVLTLPPGERYELQTGGAEMIVLPLTGSLTVSLGSDSLELVGRTSVFDSVSDFAYLPIGSTVQLLSSGGGVFALPGAVATRRLPFRYGAADAVQVELRGAGSCSRQVNNFATPGVFETDKLIACEVLTPAANWSSYPPHKHDESTASESELEEVYFYQFRSCAPSTVADSAKGIGFQQVYGSAQRPIEVLEEVSDGDVVVIPHGWHGPSIASPSHDMYYLNVMAGPGPIREWKISDDPLHGWIRDTWTAQGIDPRLPFYQS